MQIDNSQDILQVIGYLGSRLNISVTPGHMAGPVREAFEKYLGYEVTMV